jgi:hypothetical protein
LKGKCNEALIYRILNILRGSSNVLMLQGKD